MAFGDLLKDGITELETRVQRGTAALFAFFAGSTVGAFTNKYTDFALMLFGGLTCLLVVRGLYEFYRARNTTPFTQWELKLCDPTDSALRACEHVNDDYLVAGGAIELATHPQLNGQADLLHLGWKPDSEEVSLNLGLTPFNAQDAIATAGGLRSFDSPNGAKYSLVQVSAPIAARPSLDMVVASTDYYAVRTVLEHIRSSEAARRKLASVFPQHNKVPHSLCLHLLVRFSNGDVLCMRRDRTLAYHRGLWSVSAEEQLSDVDVQSTNPCMSLFQRAVCEEVLPLREGAPLSERWRVASEFVHSMALWSLFLEENIQNFALMGFVQLKCDPPSFVIRHHDLVAIGAGSRDREGDYFFVSTSSLKDLLNNGECTVTALFASDSEYLVKSQELHPTSRYRILRYLRAANRKPLTARALGTD